ncbi:MAG: type II secretion system F family protein [Ilumatobacteraceae bacterium]
MCARPARVATLVLTVVSAVTTAALVGVVQSAVVLAVGVTAVRVRPLLAPGRGRHRTAPRTADVTVSPDAAVWAQFLDAVASEVRSGTSLAESWVEAARRRPVTGRAVAPGRSLAASLALDTDDRDESVVLQVAGAATVLGGPVAATLDAGAVLLRERAAARADAAAHSAQARLSARVMTAVPLVFAGWSALSSASFRSAVTSPAGAVSIVIGAGLNAGGWRWMRAVVDRAAP